MNPEKVQQCASVDAFLLESGSVKIVAEIRFATSQTYQIQDVPKMRLRLKRDLAARIYKEPFAEIAEALAVIRQRSNHGDLELRASVEKIESVIKL